MSWTLYYVITLSLNALGLLIFRRSIYINALSLLPLLLMLDCIFQACYYHSHQEQDFNTAYSSKSNINLQERKQVKQYIVWCHLLAIPLFLPFIWFLSWGKLFSLALFFVAFISGGVWFRIRYGKQLHNRYRTEQKELEEQKKREELGQIS